MKIDTSNWKEFRVGDLFKIETSKSVDKINLEFDECNKYEYITRTSSNNGVYGRVEFLGYKPNQAGTFSVTQIGERVCQYRGVEWYASQNIFVLTPLYNSPERTCHFVTTVFNEMLKRIYGDEAYSNYPTLKTLPNDILHFPANPSGEPDWDYMEQYMKDVMDDAEAKYQTLVRISKEKHKVDTNEWGEFKLSELFEVYHGQRLTKADRVDGDIPFLTAGFENQGVAGYVGNEEIQTYMNPISVDMFGNCFFHSGLYSGDDNIYFFTNDSIANNCKLFIATSAQSVLRGKYDYGQQFRQGDADSLTIKLPVTPSGEPDWDYMEQYMKNVMNRQSNVVAALSKMMKN